MRIVIHPTWLLVPSVPTGLYRYTDDLRVLDSGRAPKPTSLPLPMRAIVTPLHWREWQASLRNHPDEFFANFVATGIKEGFRIGYDYSLQRPRSSRRNMTSATEGSPVVSAYLAKECAEGRVLGPYEPQLLPQLHISRLGVVPKHTPGQWRLIVDLSSPESHSVNDGISKSLCSLSYVSVAQAANLVASMGRGTLLAKVDIRSAYRMLPVHPDDRWLLGMKWEDSLYVDTTLPFGLRSAPKLFTAVADALQWIVEQAGARPIMHYLDDFLLAGPPESPACARNLHSLLATCSHLGVPIAWEKLEGPMTMLTFLGIEIDTSAMQLRLPHTKLTELRSLLKEWRLKRACRKRELESLTGKLQHASSVVKPGRTFLRRLFELLAGTRKDHHHIPLRGAARSDIAWWDIFIEAWNGVSIIHPHGLEEVTLHLWTDAAGGSGCGAVCDGQWFQHLWHSAPPGKAIAVLELVPIAMACMVWGPLWRGSQVVVHCDNQAIVCVVNSGYSREKNIMHLMRCVFFFRAFWGFDLRAEHVPGERNVAADALSRDNLALFFQVSPTATKEPTAVPQALIDMLVVQCPDWTSPSWVALFRSCL